jgi:hypothetical protein
MSPSRGYRPGACGRRSAARHRSAARRRPAPPRRRPPHRSPRRGPPRRGGPRRGRPPRPAGARPAWARGRRCAAAAGRDDHRDHRDHDRGDHAAHDQADRSSGGRRDRDGRGRASRGRRRLEPGLGRRTGGAGRGRHHLELSRVVAAGRLDRRALGELGRRGPGPLAGAHRGLVREPLEHERLELAAAVARRVGAAQQVVDRVLGRLVARGGIARQELHRHRLEIDRHVAGVLARRRDVGEQHPGQGLGGRPGREQVLPGQHLPQHDPDREQIAAAVERRAADLLRAHVGRLALDRHRRRGRGRGARLGDAEVTDLDRARPRTQHVVGRDVAMDQAADAIGGEGQIVGVAQAAQHLADRVDDHRERQPARIDQAVEIAALDQLHHQVQAALVVAVEVEHRDDVRVLQPRGQLGLGDEHLGEGRVARGVGQDALDRHRPLEALGAHGVGTEHLGHPAHPQRGVEDVLAEPHLAVSSDHGRSRVADQRGHCSLLLYI